VLDGEIVALDADGRPSFQALQHGSTSGLAVVFYAFDLLTVGKKSLRQQSLDARRRRLEQLVLGSITGAALGTVARLAPNVGSADRGSRGDCAGSSHSTSAPFESWAGV
jgi:ATP-dependent DNA ligase